MSVGTKVTSFIDESVQSISNTRQLAKLSGVLSKTRTVTNSDVTLYDYDSGEVIFLAITGNTDITITLPEPSEHKTGMNFKFICSATPSGTGDAVIASPTADTIVTQALVPAAEAKAPVYTLTFLGALVTSNAINMNVDGIAIASTSFAANSDATVAAIATKLQALAAISTATVTLVGGTDSDDRVITVTGANPGVQVELSEPRITGGASQTTCAVATVTQPISDTADAAESNLLADNVKIEAAALGGEWLEFICDGTYWYCRASASTTTAITLNG